MAKQNESNKMPVELSDEQLEQISGGNGSKTPDKPAKMPAEELRGMGKMGKAGLVGAGILGVGGLTEGAIGFHQNQQIIDQTKKEDAALGI